jgi:hypothetical protein
MAHRNAPSARGDACPVTVAPYRENGVNANDAKTKRPTLLTENRASAIHPNDTAWSLLCTQARQLAQGIIHTRCWRRSSGTCNMRRCGP